MSNINYYVCASVYVGPDEDLRLNGTNIAITDAPMYSAGDCASVYNDWSAEQAGPFQTQQEALDYMERTYGACRPMESAADPEIAGHILETYAAGLYERLTRPATEEFLSGCLDDICAATTDEELAAMEAELLNGMQANQGLTSDYILDVLEAERERRREGSETL